MINCYKCKWSKINKTSIYCKKIKKHIPVYLAKTTKINCVYKNKGENNDNGN